MLSTMESDRSPDELRDLLRATERAAAAPYVDFPPTPAWYPPAVGAWVAAGVALGAYQPPAAVFFPIVAVMLLSLGAFLRWYQRKRGTMPTLTDAPPEFRAVFTSYWVGLAVIAAVLVPTVVFAPPVVTVVVAFVMVTAGAAAYERAYANAAAATKNRLS